MCYLRAVAAPGIESVHQGVALTLGRWAGNVMRDIVRPPLCWWDYWPRYLMREAGGCRWSLGCARVGVFFPPALDLFQIDQLPCQRHIPRSPAGHRRFRPRVPSISFSHMDVRQGPVLSRENVSAASAHARGHHQREQVGDLHRGQFYWPSKPNL